MKKLHFTLVFAALAAAACAPADDSNSLEGPQGKADSFADTHPMNVQSAIYGESVFGSAMIGESYGTEGPTLFLLSAIHGNERSAISFGERVRTMLLGGLAERHGIRIFFVQAANPDGIAQDTRENANFIDLNRNFPAENFEAGGDHGEEPLTEPESQMLHAALNATAPVGVVSIHCCIPTFDLDGPKIGLATAMDDAMVQWSGLQFTLDDLPAYGGSMGSYVSQILQRPIVTVEFAPGDELDVIDQFYGMEAAVEAAARWTSEQPPAPAYDIDALEPLDYGQSYESFELAQSASGLPIRAEVINGGDDRRVALLAGFDGTDRRAEFIAEHVRRRLLAELPYSNILAITGVNPDGLSIGHGENADGVPIFEDMAANVPVSPEVTAVRSAVDSHGPDVLVVVVDSDRDAISAVGPDVEGVAEKIGDRPLDEPPTNTTWVERFIDAQVTVVIVEVASEFAEAQAFSGGDIGVDSQTLLGTPIVDLLY